MNTTSSLKSFLADTYALMLKTHVYHWNVMGPHFPELHKHFESQYTELFAAADRIAERIRSLGEYAPGGFKAFSALTFVNEPKMDASAEEMLEDLIENHRKLAIQAKQSIKIANENGDDATANMLTERLEEHEKQIWMMGSYFNRTCSTGNSGSCGCEPVKIKSAKM